MIYEIISNVILLATNMPFFEENMHVYSGHEEGAKSINPLMLTVAKSSLAVSRKSCR